MPGIETKTASVAGASGGTGSAVAKRLAQDGFSVVLNYSGNSDKANEAVNAIKTAAGQAISIKPT